MFPFIQTRTRLTLIYAPVAEHTVQDPRPDETRLWVESPGIRCRLSCIILHGLHKKIQASHRRKIESQRDDRESHCKEKLQHSECWFQWAEEVSQEKKRWKKEKTEKGYVLERNLKNDRDRVSFTFLSKTGR